MEKVLVGLSKRRLENGVVQLATMKKKSFRIVRGVLVKERGSKSIMGTASGMETLDYSKYSPLFWRS